MLYLFVHLAAIYLVNLAYMKFFIAFNPFTFFYYNQKAKKYLIVLPFLFYHLLLCHLLNDDVDIKIC